ncbi:hypothetical protein [Martelella soudanensis]|uniref:hypothetical protein n=1 Tax=unclassified Martelella TaxID=2629616 RepID=UPI0015E00AA1|nr:MULTISPECIES: hypothetical protein [unclassified Martelella]
MDFLLQGRERPPPRPDPALPRIAAQGQIRKLFHASKKLAGTRLPPACGAVNRNAIKTIDEIYFTN